MKLIVVATPEELNLPAASVTDGEIRIVTGVGGVNVIRSLSNFPRDTEILNVGYCGSQWFPKDAEVQIGKCKLYHPNCEYQEPCFRLSENEAMCLTAGDFVTDGQLPEHSVVDMELAYILALGFHNVQATKYVSDNLNYQQYEQTISNQ